MMSKTLKLRQKKRAPKPPADGQGHIGQSKPIEMKQNNPQCDTLGIV
jgi:hypothetical protein